MTDINDIFLKTKLSRPAVVKSTTTIISWLGKSISRLIMVCRTETQSWYVSEAKAKSTIVMSKSTIGDINRLIKSISRL